MGLEPNLEYILGLTNENGNRTHLSQTQTLVVRPRSLEPIKIERTCHLYKPVLTKD